MSDAFWVAVVGILGTLCAAIIPPLIQRSADRDKIIVEKYLDYRIKALQELELALLECQSAFLRITGEPVDTVSGARAYLESVEPKLDAYFRAQMLAEPYILDPPTKELLPGIMRAFTKLKNGVAAIASSGNPAIYPAPHQLKDSSELRDISLKLFTYVSALLNPQVLQDLHKRPGK